MTKQLPWAGKLGRIADRCIYCGDDGPMFSISSHAMGCLNPECVEARRQGAIAVPSLYREFYEKAERLAREWCKKNGVDYEQAVRDCE